MVYNPGVLLKYFSAKSSLENLCGNCSLSLISPQQSGMCKGKQFCLQRISSIKKKKSTEALFLVVQWKRVVQSVRWQFSCLKFPNFTRLVHNITFMTDNAFLQHTPSTKSLDHKCQWIGTFAGTIDVNDCGLHEHSIQPSPTSFLCPHCSCRRMCWRENSSNNRLVNVLPSG